MNIMTEHQLPHVVIVGGGFGGLAVARALRKAPVRITLVDRSNHNLFQPLLYQVATATLAPGDIAAPIRHLLRKQRNVTVAMAEVTGVDVANRRVLVNYLGRPDTPFEYDYLILATGASHSYFGHNEFEPFAPGMKTLADAESVRAKVLKAFETAEIEEDPSKHQDLLTFVLVGAGPTGVEMAGALAELRRFTLKSDFRRIDPLRARIILAEALPRILANFPEELSRKAHARLESVGVELRLGKPVTAIDDAHVVIGDETIPCRTVIWTAGVTPSPAGKWLNAPTDKAGRVRVQPDCSVPGHAEVFVIGDTASLDQDGKPLPGVAQVAMQEGHYVGKVIANRETERPAPQPFRYFDKGNMAVIGRGFAILDSPFAKLSGLPAWLAWAFIHLLFLPAFGNRLRVWTQAIWSYFTRQKSSQLIVEPRSEHTSAPPKAQISEKQSAGYQGLNVARNTGLLLLLLAGSLLCPNSLRAQSGNLGQPFEVPSLTESATDAPAETSAVIESPSAAEKSATEKGWVVGFGSINAFYHSGATIATSGQVIPGGTANVSNNLTLMFDVRRYIAKDLSLSLMGGVPPKPTITGEGSVASLGELGKVRYGPAILTAEYHLPKLHAFRPYVGAGTAYAIILKEHDAAVSQLGVRNNWGFVLEGGAEHQLSKNLALFADVKEVWLAVNAHGSLDGVVPVTAHVNLNPTIVSVGIRFRPSLRIFDRH
jgi:NADH dehydrogenase FAD-containing subunit/outer membrane protein W